MRWRMEFYQQGSGILVCYSIEAASPGAAVLLGRKALLDEHPSMGRPARKLSLAQRAERLSAPDAGGWVLYRIGADEGPRSADVAPGRAT